MKQTTATRIVIDVRSGIPFDRRIYRDVALAAVAAEIDKRGGQARAFFDDPKPSAFAQACASEMTAAEEYAKRQDAIAATGVYSPTEAEIAEQRKKLDEHAASIPAPDMRRLHETDAQTRERITGSIADVAARTVRAGFDPGEVARVNAIARPGLDPTTDAIAAQNAERAIWRSDLEHAREEARTYAKKLEAVRVDLAHMTTERDAAKRIGQRIAIDAKQLEVDLSNARLEADRVSERWQRGVEMWREAHPDSALTIPAGEVVVSWLLDQLDAAVTEADNARSSAGIEADLRSKLDAWKSAGEDWGKRFKAKVAENESLQRRLDELIKQRDFMEGRANEANHRHAQASSALEVMTIKWLELVNEAKRLMLDRGEINHNALKLAAEAREAKEAIARMMPLCKAAQDWELGISHARKAPISQFDIDLAHAVDAYQTACAQAADKNEQIPASEPASK